MVLFRTSRISVFQLALLSVWRLRLRLRLLKDVCRIFPLTMVPAMMFTFLLIIFCGMQGWQPFGLIAVVIIANSKQGLHRNTNWLIEWLNDTIGSLLTRSNRMLQWKHTCTCVNFEYSCNTYMYVIWITQYHWTHLLWIYFI